MCVCVCVCVYIYIYIYIYIKLPNLTTNFKGLLFNEEMAPS